MNTLLNNLRSLSVVLLLFISCSATKLFAQSPDYTQVYYPVINEAEVNILNQNYADALIAYKQAFASVPSPFARDYFNAAVSALQVEDEKLAFDYLEKLALKGVSLKYLQKQEAFEDVQNAKRWKKFVKKYPKYRKKYKKAVNVDLRADLDELYARDQYFRQAKGGYRVYGDTLKQIEDANVKRFLKWVEQYGYPGEALIGVADSLEQLPRFYIVIERQTKARNGYDFTDLILEAVQQGNLAPQTAAFLLDKQAGSNLYGSKAFVKLNCSNCDENSILNRSKQYFVKAKSEQELDQINKRRESLGLDAVEDYLMKVIFEMENSKFKLATDWAIANYYVPSQEAAKIMMENLLAVDYEYHRKFLEQNR